MKYGNKNCKHEWKIDVKMGADIFNIFTKGICPTIFMRLKCKKCGARNEYKNMGDLE